MIGKAFRRAYRELIGDRRRHMPFWILVGFLPTFLAARLLVAAQPALFLNVRGVHVHHFTYGIIVLAIVGFVAIVAPHISRQWLAAFYGAGLALAFDETGMWLRLTADYRLDQSENVMVAILVFLVAAVYFTGILRRAAHLMRRR